MHKTRYPIPTNLSSEQAALEALKFTGAPSQVAMVNAAARWLIQEPKKASKPFRDTIHKINGKIIEDDFCSYHKLDALTKSLYDDARENSIAAGAVDDLIEMAETFVDVEEHAKANLLLPQQVRSVNVRLANVRTYVRALVYGVR